jgi:hypothetical protein
MIYILEIPHQLPAKCWSCDSEADVVRVVTESLLSKRSSYELPETFADAVEINGHDLHAQYDYMSDAEAIEGLTRLTGHQADRACQALRAELIANGVLAAKKRSWE